MSNDDDLLGPISATIAAREEVQGAIVTSFVVIATFVDAEGENAIYTETSEGQRCHETLGLLAFGLAREQRRAAFGEYE